MRLAELRVSRFCLACNSFVLVREIERERTASQEHKVALANVACEKGNTSGESHNDENNF